MLRTIGLLALAGLSGCTPPWQPQSSAHCHFDHIILQVHPSARETGAIQIGRNDALAVALFAPKSQGGYLNPVPSPGTIFTPTAEQNFSTGELCLVKYPPIPPEHTATYGMWRPRSTGSVTVTADLRRIDGTVDPSQRFTLRVTIR
jgi:hypothetical protein